MPLFFLEFILFCVIVTICICFMKSVWHFLTAAPRSSKSDREWREASAKELTLAELKRKKEELNRELAVTEELIDTTDAINQGEQVLTEMDREFEQVYIDRKEPSHDRPVRRSNKSRHHSMPG